MSNIFLFHGNRFLKMTHIRLERQPDCRVCCVSKLVEKLSFDALTLCKLRDVPWCKTQIGQI